MNAAVETSPVRRPGSHFEGRGALVVCCAVVVFLCAGSPPEEIQDGARSNSEVKGRRAEVAPPAMKMTGRMGEDAREMPDEATEESDEDQGWS